MVLVLDDLHWADAPTLHLLRHLVRGAAGSAILVLATYRDTDLSRRHPLAEALADMRREKLVDRLPLRGLTEEDVAELLRRTAGHQIPAPFVRALHGETEGNPFFLEEVLRHLVESGAIFERGGHWTSDRPIDQLGIPEGVREAVGRRLARLSETCNRALSAAAVLGRSWDFELLVEMVGASDDELLDAVEDGLAAQLIVERAGLHAFTHALVRETLYEELSLPRRQRLHLRAADAIERRYAHDLDGQASALALHLRMAGAAADPAKALEWSLRAGAVAAAALAWEEAIDHLEAAVEHMEELGGPPAERARVLERAADLKYIAGFDLEGAVRNLESALRAYESAGLPERAARVHSRIARDRATFLGPTHDVPTAIEHLEAARAVLELEPEGVPMAYLLIAEATAAVWLMEDMRKPQRLAERAMEIADRVGHRRLWGNAAALAGNARASRGELGVGLELVEQAWQEADRLNDPWVAFLAAWSIAGMGLWVSGARSTLGAVERELRKPRVAGAAGQRSFLTLLRGQAHVGLGDLVAAEAAHDEAQSLMPWGFDAMLLGMRGDYEKAVERFEATIADSRSSGNRWSEVALGLRMAELLTITDDPRARELTESCVAVSTAAGHQILEANARVHAAASSVEWGTQEAGREHLARCRVIVAGEEDWGIVLARVEQAAGALADDEGEAESCFQRAMAVAEGLEMPFVQADVLRSHGLFLAERDPGRAVDRLDRAIAIYEDAGAGPVWTDRLRADRRRPAALVGT